MIKEAFNFLMSSGPTEITFDKEIPVKTRSQQLSPVYVNILQPKPGELMPFRVYERIADANNSTDTTIVHRGLKGTVVVNLPVVTKVEITEAKIDSIFDAWSKVEPESRHMNLREFFKMHAFSGAESLAKVKAPSDDEC